MAVGQIFKRDVANRHRRRIGLDAHRRLRAVHRNLADAGQNADALADLRVGVVVELAFGGRVADQRDIHDRLIVRVRLGKRRRAGQIDGKLSLRARDCRLHVGGGSVQALREIELQHEAGVSLTVVGGHQFQARNLHELALQRRGHVVRHRLGRCARIVDLHLDHGIIDGRQIADRQAKIGHHSEQDDRDGQRHRHDGTTNEEFGEIHDWPPGFCAALPLAFEAGAELELSSTRTLPPGRTSIWPASTTRSFAATPSVTTT